MSLTFWILRSKIFFVSYIWQSCCQLYPCQRGIPKISSNVLSISRNLPRLLVSHECFPDKMLPEMYFYCSTHSQFASKFNNKIYLFRIRYQSAVNVAEFTFEFLFFNGQSSCNCRRKIEFSVTLRLVEWLECRNNYESQYVKWKGPDFQTLILI